MFHGFFFFFFFSIHSLKLQIPGADLSWISVKILISWQLLCIVCSGEAHPAGRQSSSEVTLLMLPILYGLVVHRMVAEFFSSNLSRKAAKSLGPFSDILFYIPNWYLFWFQNPTCELRWMADSITWITEEIYTLIGCAVHGRRKPDKLIDAVILVKQFAFFARTRKCCSSFLYLPEHHQQQMENKQWTTEV